MPPIPVYLKTDPAMPRPSDPEYFLLTQNGAFLCRNHPFFASDVRSNRPLRALAEHDQGVCVRYPRVGACLLESIVGFFSRVYDLHRSEAVVLLVWDLAEQRYRLVVPEQEATVWRSGITRSPQDVRYQVPVLPAGQLLVGDVHSHGSMEAYTSWTDARDERHRDGVHAVVGRIEREPPELHVELAVDGERFLLRPEEIFEGYQQRRAFVPQQWMDRLVVREVGWTDWYEPLPRRRRDDPWA